MFAKTAFGLAIILATASGALATTTKNRNVDSSHIVYSNVYNPAGARVSTDPDFNLRPELNRDWGQGD